MLEKVLALVPFTSCTTGKVFVMTHMPHEYHIKVKKSGGAFKLSQQFSCTTIVACLDSDLKESKDKRNLYTNQKSKLQA